MSETWMDRPFERIPETHIAARVFWQASRIIDQSRPKPRALPRVNGDEAYTRAVRIVRSLDEGLGMPMDEVWE